MSVFSKIVTGVFGKKSDKDFKVLSPFVDKINDYYKTLADLTDEELKSKFLSISEEFKSIAIRPKYSCLNTNKALKTSNFTNQNWKDSLQDILKEIFQNK